MTEVELLELILEQAEHHTSLLDQLRSMLGWVMLFIGYWMGWVAVPLMFGRQSIDGEGGEG